MEAHILVLSLGVFSFGAIGVPGCSSSSSPAPPGSSLSSSTSTGSSGVSSSTSSGLHADAGAAPPVDAGSGDATVVVGDAATLLPCLTVTCVLPGEVCCPGLDLDGGAECPDADTCNAAGADLYECVGEKNCPSGQVCCVNYGAADGGGDLATCEDADICAAGFGGNPGTDQVCVSDGECASLGETCQAISGTALTICN